MVKMRCVGIEVALLGEMFEYYSADLLVRIFFLAGLSGGSHVSGPGSENPH